MKSMKDSVEVRLDTKSSDGFKGSLKSAPNSSAIFFASFLEGASAGLLADATLVNQAPIWDPEMK